MPWMPSVASADGASDVRVTGFGKTVQVFASKQLPKKLEFFGDDFRSHYWIVKVRIRSLICLHVHAVWPWTLRPPIGSAAGCWISTHPSHLRRCGGLCVISGV